LTATRYAPAEQADEFLPAAAKNAMRGKSAIGGPALQGGFFGSFFATKERTF
jgi:hypothetical protein